MCDTMEYVGGDGFVFEPLYLPHDLYVDKRPSLAF
jgi:hypothetical protein